ncbi:hypothetical protein [Dyadobacter sandarakinus]|uniref:Uncharacterized protein n=1 Tax=Dyadobacter sandarakinus TaxID=2747268 RepID=A0ABX7I6G0_9BACT|nr:hypothetical protein [Dyadobacter sandarakinus]QRR01469.1 hypothetical protein HWI92_11420 [Dyadobacter sandarakinus]
MTDRHTQLLYFYCVASCLAAAFFVVRLLNEEQQDKERIGRKYRDRSYLVKNIIPDTTVRYWRYVDKVSNMIIREAGDKSTLSAYTIEDPNKGFFDNGHMVVSYSYIVYADSSGLHYVSDKDSFQKFIGHVDNISEAILIGMAEGLSIDTRNKKGGSYIATKFGYAMKLLKYNNCPETFESILFSIKYNGDFQIKSDRVYSRTGDCIQF